MLATIRLLTKPRTGKGMVKTLSAAYPEVRIAAIDYDPGSSAVNQANRLKLLLSTMFE